MRLVEVPWDVTNYDFSSIDSACKWSESTVIKCAVFTVKTTDGVVFSVAKRTPKRIAIFNFFFSFLRLNCPY